MRFGRLFYKKLRLLWWAARYKLRRIRFELGHDEVRSAVALAAGTALAAAAVVVVFVLVPSVPIRCLAAIFGGSAGLVLFVEAGAQCDHLRMTRDKRTIRWLRRNGWIIRGFGY